MDATVQLIEDLTDVALGRAAGNPHLANLPDRGAVHRHLQSLADNAPVDAMPEPAGRNRMTKRAILTGARFLLTRQRAVNQALLGVVHELLAELDLLSAMTEQERRRAAAASAALDSRLVKSANVQHQRVDELRELVGTRVEELRSAIGANIDEVAQGLATVEHELGAEVRAAIEARDEAISAHDERLDVIAKRVDDLTADLLVERHRREILERELRAVRSERSRQPVEAESTPSGVGETQTFDSAGLSELYDRFERFFRPTGADLESRFTGYLPDLEYLKGGRLPLLDIGTGRGEFLEVLRDAEIPARGVDTNPDAVKRAHQSGLDVELVDAMAHLSSLDGESVGAVTAFHVVEHIEPAELIDLVDEIVRVLAPGGTVILETPNPTNLVVGAASFYHDPTHRRPLTPDYLAFLLRDRGLVDVETRFLHPLPEFAMPLQLAEVPGQHGIEALLEDVRWALKGPQDFAVIARGPGGS